MELIEIFAHLLIESSLEREEKEEFIHNCLTKRGPCKFADPNFGVNMANNILKRNKQTKYQQTLNKAK